MSSQIPQPPFYPDDLPQTRVQQHWAALDGAPRIPLDDSNRGHIRRVLDGLLQYDPTSTGRHLWLVDDLFRSGFYLLLYYFGEEDHEQNQPPMVKTQQFFMPNRYRINPAKVSSAFGVSWPGWDQWCANMKAQEGLMRRDCAQSGLNVPPWEQRIWEAGNKVKALIGHAMRPLAAQQGKTPYDRWLRFLDQNQQWLAYLDTFATQLSTSSTLSMLLSNGYVGADGTLINRECLQINKQALVDHFHLKDKEDVEKEFTFFRQHQWPVLIHALLRQSVALRRNLESHHVNGAYHQARWIVGIPEDTPALERWSTMMQAMDERSSRVIIGKQLELIRSSFVQPTRPTETPIRTAASVVIQQEAERLLRSRDILVESVNLLDDAYTTWRDTRVAPTQLATDTCPILSFRNFVKWDAGGVKVEGEPGKMDLSFAEKEDGDDGEDGAQNLKLTSLDVADPPPPASSQQVIPSNTDYFAEWAAGLRRDVAKFLADAGRREQFFRLTEVFVDSFTSAWDDSARESGIDKLWVRPETRAAGKRTSSQTGQSVLRECQSFQEPLMDENFFAISSLLKMFGSSIPTQQAELLKRRISLALCCAMMSKRFTLYATAIDHIVDASTSHFDHHCIDNGWDEQKRSSGLGAIRAIGNFADGMMIACTVGCRTFPAKDSHSQIKRWIRAILFPEASVLSRPFGWGMPLICRECGPDSDRELVHPDEVSGGESGHPGVMRSVNLRERLSVVCFNARRGADVRYTNAVGRLAYYYCLVILFIFYFHPDFVVVFIYFATMIHYTDRARRGKAEAVFLANGFGDATLI